MQLKMIWYLNSGIMVERAAGLCQANVMKPINDLENICKKS